MFGKKNKPFFIAEISANHNKSFKNAIQLINDAKKFGADAVKLQTYTATSMTVNSFKKYFQIKTGLWKGYNLWRLYQKANTPYSWHKKLFDHAKKIGIKIFSSPFDENAVDLLESLNCPYYKVASFEMSHYPLLKKIAQTNKPIIISTGMSTLDEITQTYNTVKSFGAKNVSLLYCVSNYPSSIKDFNLNNIKVMKKKLKCEIGFSDHSNDFRIPAIAVKLGATIVEKHVRLKNVKALDYEFSIDGVNIRKYKYKINKLESINYKSDFFKKIAGKKYFFRNKSENKSKFLRRSIFVVKNIKKGEKFTKHNIKNIRPGHGISPIFYEQILGRKSFINLKKHEPLKKKDLNFNLIDD